MISAVLSVVMVGVGAFSGALAGSPVFGIAGAVGLVALVPSRVVEPETRLAAVLSGVLVAPIVFFGYVFAATPTLVASDFVCGTPLAALMMLVPFIAASVLVVGVLVIRVVVHRARVGSVLRGLAIVAAALAFALWGLAPRDGVEPDAWVSSLPIVAEERAADAGDRLGPFVVERSVEQGERTIGFRPQAAPPDSYPSTFRYDETTQLVLRHDSRSGIHVLERDGQPVLALRVGEPRPTDVRAHDVRDQLVAPRAWIRTAAAGGAVAIALLVISLVAGRRPRWLASARPAHVEDDSTSLAFLDGALPARGVSRTLLPPGPALAIAPAGLPSYRTDGTLGPIDARPGSRATHLRAADTRGAVWSALALVTATLAASPLLAAILVLG